MTLPLAPLERVLREQGAVRVSEDATRALRDEVRRFAENLAAEAVKAARHAGRTTVKREDVALAARR
jgi:histone H3/H4